MIAFVKDVDELSLSSGKSININLIKKLLKKIMNKFRTHNCGELGIENINEIVTLSGWLHRRRDPWKFAFY